VKEGDLVAHKSVRGCYGIVICSDPLRAHVKWLNFAPTNQGLFSNHHPRMLKIISEA
jgi:hypothetical protein